MFVFFAGATELDCSKVTGIGPTECEKLTKVFTNRPYKSKLIAVFVFRL
jgi:hypothetical protein